MKYLLSGFLIFFLSQLFYCQNSPQYNVYEKSLTNPSHDYEVIECTSWSIDLPSRKWGLSIGNSNNFNGIRFNYRDCNVETINGLIFTIWDARSVKNSEVNGISIGGMPHASRLNGLNVGLGFIGEEEVNGINLGILAAVSNGNMNGLNIGGLATVASSNMSGVNFGGLAVVSEGDMRGLNFAGLAQVANGNLSGINFGGLAVVSQGNLSGFSFAGLALVADGHLSGVNISLLACVANENMTGINITGLALVSTGNLAGVNVGGLAAVGTESIYGLSVTIGQLQTENEIWGLGISGYKTETFDFTGANFTLAWTEIQNLRGFSFAVYNRIYGEQDGLTIGIVNYAEELNGIQLGLINIAGNNSGIFKVLPIINVNL